jgi:small membrane protein
MNLLQIVITVAFGLVIFRLLALVRRGKVNWRRALLWVLLWLAGLVVVWRPEVSVRIARLVGVGRGVDAIVYFSIALLSYLMFRIYLLSERQDQLLTKLVSEIALQNGKDQFGEQKAEGQEARKREKKELSSGSDSGAEPE